ncbi:MAG: metallophosphoesterase family protein [Candidatus Neomarinimicrobiota bacterium]
MRLAVISDIHANKEALDEVMESIKHRSINSIFCLGDLVNYGTDFEYCIDFVENRAETCVMGNHDSTVIGRDPLWHMNREARRSARWTMARLTHEQRSYLESLPMDHSHNDILFTHGSPESPDRWHYITNWFDAARQFDNFQERICMVGHSHIPGIYNNREEGNFYSERIHSLDPESRYIVNVGSVGQPRDRDPRASYVVIDEGEGTVEFVRVEYDVEKASKKIASEGMSNFNARRILEGI